MVSADWSRTAAGRAPTSSTSWQPSTPPSRSGSPIPTPSPSPYSYGGLATAALTTMTDRFRAAAIGGSLVDLRTFVVGSDLGPRLAARRWAAPPGTPTVSTPDHRSAVPTACARHADRARHRRPADARHPRRTLVPGVAGPRRPERAGASTRGQSRLRHQRAANGGPRRRSPHRRLDPPSRLNAPGSQRRDLERCQVHLGPAVGDGRHRAVERFLVEPAPDDVIQMPDVIRTAVVPATGSTRARSRRRRRPPVWSP